MERKNILQIKNLIKGYGSRGGYETRVIKGISMDICKGDFIAVMGPSGSGKTTLLNLLSTLDKPDAGQIILDGEDLGKAGNKRLSEIRRDKIGFIFQEYNLLDNMSLEDNIALPLSLNGVKSTETVRRVRETAGMFGLTEHLKKYPYQLSGGQKQRGAAARALVTEPEILFADEPTGALDSRSGRELLASLESANRNGNAAILMVTHDAYAASYAKQVCLLTDGRIRCRLVKKEDRKAFYERILDLQISMGGDPE